MLVIFQVALNCLFTKWWLGRQATLGVSLLGCVACTFPPYAPDTSAAAGQATMGGSGGASVMAGGGGGSSGSAGDGGAGGEAGGADPGLVVDWSEAAVEQLGFELLHFARVEAEGIALTNKDVKNMLGAIVQKQQLDLTLSPELEIELGFRITPSAVNGDGLALVLHASPDGHTRLGDGGGGLAFGGVDPCVAIELDTAEIAAADLPAPHLALMPGCHPDDHGPATTALGGDPSDGADWTLSGRWSAETGLLEVTLRSEATGRETELSEPVDLLSLVGPKLWVVVTGANGEFAATHFVRRLRLAGGGLSPRTLTNVEPIP